MISTKQYYDLDKKYNVNKNKSKSFLDGVISDLKIMCVIGCTAGVFLCAGSKLNEFKSSQINVSGGPVGYTLKNYNLQNNLNNISSINIDTISNNFQVSYNSRTNTRTYEGYMTCSQGSSLIDRLTNSVPEDNNYVVFGSLTFKKN